MNDEKMLIQVDVVGWHRDEINRDSKKGKQGCDSFDKILHLFPKTTSDTCIFISYTNIKDSLT